MDLRSKLARLKPNGPPPSQGTVPVAPEAPPSAVLEDLRHRMAALVARSRSRLEDERAEREAEVARRLALDPLPFDEEPTEHGPVHVRRVVHPVGSRVGWADVHAARTARGEDLALLALDPSLRDADPARALYLDTEATGLSGGTGTIPFLVGLAWFEGDHLVAEQLLLRRLGEEAPLLARLVDRLASSSMLVTFNGKSFDLPLLRTRFVMNRLARPVEPPHFDLVHLARRIHRRPPLAGGRRAPQADASSADARGVEGPTLERWDDEGARRASSCKLVALERTLLGFAREGDIEGGEVPSRYAQFLRHGDADAIRAVCDHNLWDVVSMAALVGVYADGLAAVNRSEERAPSRLSSRDLVGLARTLDRAGALSLARRAADAAVADAERGTGARGWPSDDPWLAISARTLRGRLHKKAADVEAARDDFAHLADHHDDPAARLELAKLLEHRLRAPEEALAVVERGTSEAEEAASHRRERLARKVREGRGGAGGAQLRLDARRPKH